MLRYTLFKFCPRCGKSGLRSRQKNALRCAQCGCVYFHNTASAVGAIIEIDDRIVLVKRGLPPKKGCFDLPGGFVDYNESMETALAREIREELHCPLEQTRYFGSFANKYSYLSITYFTCDAIFICKAPPNAALSPNGEIGQISLVGPGDIDFTSVGFQSIRAALRAYVSSRKKTYRK